MGDIEIRRALLTRLTDAGFRLVVFTGTMPASYVEAYRLPTTTRLTSNSLEFQARFLRDALLGRASLVFSPGPYIATGGAGAMAKALVNHANVRVARATGGKVVAAGRAYRVDSKSVGRLERSSLRRFDLVAVRDDVSSAEIGLPLRREPDLAMLHPFERPVEDAGRYLAVSLRSDRPVSLALLEELRDSASEQNLQMVFVTQVKRDAEGHRALATALGVGLVDWLDEPHAHQESRVLEVYRESAVVVSNRLHSILLASRSGAVPITFAGDGTHKIASTLGTEFPLRLIHVNTDGVLAKGIDGSTLLRREDRDIDALERAFTEARARLNRLGDDLEGCLRG
ncbi:polysaccharide pyruvyl transferase family protein [Agromyces sp. NDB4Y10]|uniref:polysaccharide pyruvyl transferase family protein n=1 Tax=Agromyces sp. NDB4Y10 TaxID=1775951 RepID=UPI0018D39064|nr:polysaccharide pyruvyl transferase family protein [Agromyces sp. NDB4Y10]